MSEEYLIKRTHESEVEVRRGRERLCTRWLDGVIKDA